MCQANVAHSFLTESNKGLRLEKDMQGHVCQELLLCTMI